jgi:beta-glucosidase
LYIGFPSSAPETPVRQLRGFVKETLKAGETKQIQFELRRKDLSYWDKSSSKWVVPKGDFQVEVGASSRDMRLSGKITVS